MASNLSKKIAKGDIGAYKELYNNTRSRVWYINYLLLCDKESANESTKAVFKNAFSDIAATPEKGESFAEFVEEKAVTYCKIKLAKNNNKEFKIPESKNFSSFACDERSACVNDDLQLSLLASMPSLHRFIFVMSTYLKWSDKKIAEFFHTNEETIRLAYDADTANVAKIARAISIAADKDVSFTKDELVSLIECAESSFDFDSEVDKQIVLAISDISAPAKEKARKKTNKKLIICLIASVVILLVSVIFCVVAFNKKNNDPNAVTHYATIEIEGYGTIKLELYGNMAPETVKNFETLANKGFYNGLTFHRIIEDFMMQGGCPEGNGTGGNKDANGKEINIKGEFSENGHENTILHKRGVISMARSDSYNSASSQFFIMHADATHLDGKYASFGRVIEGMNVVDAVCTEAEPIDNNGTIAAAEQPKIKSIKVTKAK